MDSALYTCSAKTLAALQGAPRMAACSVAEPLASPLVSPLRRNFRAAQGFAAAAVAEAPAGGIAMYSPAFYAACTVGGVLSCGLTHMAVTPLDIVKCNMQVRLAGDGAWLGAEAWAQVDPVKFKSIPVGFSLVVKEQGAAGLFKGWAPTLAGYSAQGACKFGLYEFFKKCGARAAAAGLPHTYLQVLLGPGWR